MNHSEIVSFIWGVADLIRDTFKRGKYQDVILPLTVLRRLDCVLAPTREDVLQRQAELKGRGLEDLHRQLCRASGFAFYNTSQYDFERLLGDHSNVAANLRNYIAGFSENMREVLERFGGVDLHPDRIDNAAMGTIFEELIRRFNEALNENPGEHFTPRDERAVREEHNRGAMGRFGPGLPRISDGQLLFLLHMLAHTKGPDQGGSRIAIIMNGSPLFTGDAGSGESEIRRYIFENDLLEALIALPEQLFYNTGIATYIWLLTNRKTSERQDKVQLIDASSFWEPMRRSLGDKRREITPEKAEDILKLLVDFRDGDTRMVTKDGSREEAVVSRVFPTSHFGYRKITVERPLRLSFLASPERISRLDEERGFQSLAKSKKRGYAGSREETQGIRLQRRLRDLLGDMPETTVTDRAVFGDMLDDALKRAELKLPAPAKRAVLNALSERDENAAVCYGCKGEPDPELRDTERVPLAESVDDFFDREVLPHVADAWIDESKRDPKDGQVGIVGYEINFNRHFYRYTPPRPLEDIESDIRDIEADIVRMLGKVTGAAARDRLEARQRTKGFQSPEDLRRFFDECDARREPGVEPDWEEHKRAIEKSILDSLPNV